MKLVLAPDSFKESISSIEVCKALEKGILMEMEWAEVIKCPIADGGEGTVEALLSIPGATLHTSRVHGPLGDLVEAKWSLIPAPGRTAIIEMAAAAGLPLLSPEDRNPLITTTQGVGELIMEALEEKVDRIIVGLGGSATNDGGAGMLQTLGFDLLDEYNHPIKGTNAGLSELKMIKSDNLDPRALSVKFMAASDVRNILLGPDGASQVYGPQKGALPDMVPEMERNMIRFSEVVSKWKGAHMETVPGSGAAGGLGFAFLAFLNAEIRSGFDLVAELTDLESKIATADWVVTGEGKLDAQTLSGKGPFGVAQIAKKHGKPVVAIGGQIDEDVYSRLMEAFDMVFKISPSGTSKDESIKHAKDFLIDTGRQIAKYVKEKHSS